MTTIYRDIPLTLNASDAWQRLRDPSMIDKVVPVVASSTVDGDRRVCTTADGSEIREVILGVDDEHRRISYAVLQSPWGFEFHASSMQVVEQDGEVRMRWITDVKPDTLAEQLAEVIDAQVAGVQGALS
ncbi:MAG: SRPBCC family protein [Deltaproteobacteria bacterium]|nr:SRPBCC family protein [Deltaproteobacteria bacterium]